MIYNRIEDVIGNTPLVKLDAPHYGINNVDIYVKLEYLNPFGSVKDRTARGMINDDKLRDLKDTQTGIIESSSGNTAKALQMLANKHELHFTSVTNRIKIPETESLLRYLGTEVRSLPGRSECADPNDKDNAVAVIETMMREHPDAYYHTSQYTNMDNTAVHEQTTATEIYNDLSDIDIVVTGVGTGGTSGGLIDYAKHHTLSTTHIGVVSDPHDFLPGIRTQAELFETNLFEKEEFDEIREVSSLDALVALRRLVTHDGILAGPTTGASFAALLSYAQTHDVKREDGTKQAAVFIACDRLEGYMSYIAQRQPELFHSSANNDIFTTIVTEAEQAALDKPANFETELWIKQNDVLVVDTRGVKPYEQFHIDGAINFPEEHLVELLPNGSPFPRNATILFVCPRGDRSLHLASVMNKRGIKSYSLAGGLMAWRNNGLAFVRKGQ